MEEEEEEDGEEGGEFLDDLDVDQDWEDVEDWKTSEVPVSIITQWSGVPQCPPPPPPLAVSNHINSPRPPRSSYLSARSLYGLNGSLSDSTESLPVMVKEKLNSLERLSTQLFIFSRRIPTWFTVQ